MNLNKDIISTYPLPPLHYIDQYTDENLKKVNSRLNPPPIPTDSYTSFGATYEVDEIPLKSLESHGIRRLYPQKYNRKQELEKILKSILTNFFDLLDILINDPDCPQRLEKLDDLNLLFIHMSHLNNEYRPLQAKFILKSLMKRQLQERKDVTQSLKQNLVKTREILDAMKILLPDEKAIESATKGFRDKEYMDIEIEKKDIANQIIVNDKSKKLSSYDDLLEKDNILFSLFDDI